MARSFASFSRQSMTDAGRIIDADERHAAMPEIEKEQLLPYHVKPRRWGEKPGHRVEQIHGLAHVLVGASTPIKSGAGFCRNMR